MKLWALIKLTFVESLAKKSFIAFFAISTLTSLLFIFALNLDIVDGAKSYISVFGQDSGQAFDLEKIVFGTQGVLAIMLFSGGIFLSLFATSNLVPSMLEKGNIDLWIAKPLSRLQLWLGRFLGAVGIVTFNVLYLVILTWIIISLKIGIWNWGYLMAAFMIIAVFAVLYAFMSLMALLTRSGPFALMLTYMIVFFSPLLLARDQIYALLSSPVYGHIVDGLYYIFPKMAELSEITKNLVSAEAVSSWMPLWTAALFGLAMFSLSGFIFAKKDY